MTLTYIFHSGFVLETEKSILIFDYWLDLNGVVPFPIDGRIGRSSSARLLPTGRKNGYTLGGRQFIERFQVGLFVPMHFVASGFESAWRMKEFTDEKGIPFWEITREGETIEI